MTTKVVPGMLIATADAREVAVEGAGRMARVLRKALLERSRACIALSGGTTPRAAYAELARADGIDWTRVEVFFVDERAGAADSERSNYRMVRESLLTVAKVPEENVARMPAEGADLEAAAREYQARIEARVPRREDVPAFDLVVFGIGTDGHTASLFPGEPAIEITDRWVAHVPARAEHEDRLTLTVPVLEHAQNAVVLAVGAEKREALERAWLVKGDLTTTPARIVRAVQGSVVWVIDRAAGGLG